MTEPARGGAGALLWPAALLVVSALGWGILYSLNRLATTDGIPFIPYVFWMGTGAALILLGLGAVFRTLPRLSWEHVRGYLVLGTISFGLSYTVLAFVAPKVPAGVLGLGATLTPILTYPAAALFRMDRFRAIRTLGLVLGVAGVALVVVPETSLPTHDMAPWVLLSFVTPLLYVANALIIAWLKPPAAGALPLAVGVLATGAVFMFVVMAATGQWWWFRGADDRRRLGAGRRGGGHGAGLLSDGRDHPRRRPRLLHDRQLHDPAHRHRLGVCFSSAKATAIGSGSRWSSCSPASFWSIGRPPRRATHPIQRLDAHAAPGAICASGAGGSRR